MFCATFLLVSSPLRWYHQPDIDGRSQQEVVSPGQTLGAVSLLAGCDL